jgi:hypothetical protein
MPDLGNLASRLRLWCHHCRWLPPEDMEMALVQAHYGLEHPDAGKITLDLKPACPCGDPMEHTETRPTGGGFKDYFTCPACGSTGWAKRDPASRN